MSQLADRSLEAHWRAFAKSVGLPTFKVTTTDYHGEEALLVEFDLGYMRAAFDSEKHRQKIMSQYNLRVLDVLDGSGRGQCIVGWFQ